MFDIGGGEILLILLVVLLLFGPKRIPEVAHMIGKGVQRIRRTQEELVNNIRQINTSTEEFTQPLTTVTRELGETLARFPEAPIDSENQSHPNAQTPPSSKE